MPVKKLLLAPIALVAFAAPALAEDWVKIPDQPEGQFWIDRDSIEVRGALTYFRTRIQLTDVAGLGYATSAVDCKTQDVDILKLELESDGKVVASQDFVPGEKRHSLKDDSGAKIFALVCR